MIRKYISIILMAMLLTAGTAGCSAKTDVTPQPEPVPEQTENETADVTDETGKEEDFEETDFDEEHPDNELVLIGSSYTGLTNIRNDNYDDGTYYYEDLTSDGITTITNMSYPNSQKDGQAMDAYVINIICAQIDPDATVDDPVANDSLSEKFTYPVYTATWESGSNEDTKKAAGVVVLTDLYTYYYGFACPIDSYGENESFYMEELDNLTLSEAGAAEVSDDGGIVDEDLNIDADGELMDYYGKNIDELMSVFPNLEILSREGDYDKNGAVYIDKEEEYDGVLSGPTFDVDSDSNIVGITYSGRRFVLEGLCAAVLMEDAVKTVKGNGWKFTDVEFAHGTAQAVANYEKDGMRLSIVSTDDECEFGNTEESDIGGSVETVSITKK